MFSAQLADPIPAIFRPKVAPDPEIQRRIEEKLTEVVTILQRRRISAHRSLRVMPGSFLRSGDEKIERLIERG